jgi:hypothetical protein
MKLFLSLKVYYPDNNTVITISDKLPQETTVDSLYSAQMVSYGDKLGANFNKFSLAFTPKSQTVFEWKGKVISKLKGLTYW